MATVQPETIAVQALRQHLLNKLPAKVAAINAERGAAIRAGRPGPYTVTAGMSLKVGATPGSEVTKALTAGSRTASQAAAELAGVTGVTASADALGRLVLSAADPPVSAPSEVYLAGDDTGANEIFGWNPGGERSYREPIQPPLRSGVLDGDFHELPLVGRFGIVIGDKVTEPDGNPRRDMHAVRMTLAVHVPVPTHGEGYSELTAQCARAIREVILEDQTLEGQVVLAEVSRATVMGTAFRFETGSVSPLIARADVAVRVKVFQRAP